MGSNKDYLKLLEKKDLIKKIFELEKANESLSKKIIKAQCKIEEVSKALVLN